MNANDEAPSNSEPTSPQKEDKNEGEVVEDDTAEASAKPADDADATNSKVVAGAI